MGLEVPGTPASGDIECSIDSLGVAINSIQQFLTTFAVSKAIISSCNSDPTLTANPASKVQQGWFTRPKAEIKLSAAF
jgi:hypothetical protein